MATRFYFHNASNTGIGTFPTTEQSASTPTVSVTGANTLRTMNTSIGVAQTSLTFTSLANTTAQSAFLGYFATPPLVGAQTVGGGTMILNAAENEASLNGNFWVNALNVYVWRPSTGTRVGVVRDAAAVSLGGLEPTNNNSQQVTHITGITSTAVSAADGDIVVCEVWARYTQGNATARVNLWYFDGTTVTTTENSVVTNHASFLELTENLVFTAGGFPYSFAVLV